MTVAAVREVVGSIVTVPWWKSQLEVVRARMRAHVAARMPSRSDLHEDIVEDAIVSVLEWMARKEVPHHWIAGPTSAEHEGTFFSFCYVILRRRIADRFRLETSEWKYRADVEDEFLERVPSQDGDPSRALVLHRIMMATAKAFAELSSEDRDLLSMSTLDVHPALSGRERKRLQRVRDRIVEEIRREVGAAAEPFLTGGIT